MLILNIVYNDPNFIRSIEDYISKSNLEIKINSYNDQYYKERKKGFKLKGGYSARITPFCALLNDKKCIKAFYSEDNSCTIDNILKTLKTLI